ncbi:t-complex protein 1 subunit zeta [Anaeramoeba flamelloides]|uniref:T-complex protein 1 subunit zeta n=1 Tax=Anaeramoeba flamelloides TaxID=1746091 RepID=A0AAV7YRI9_9EUKA|nr:t-complex protein 1 subunit zeta [Anaeramoeba flamelloides]KAJ6239213.1 t-complex protein 1 subunit zeta [Anaeramoeba flamelloides]
MSLRQLNKNSDIAQFGQALYINLSAAKGLQAVLRSNLGPKGTIKMLVSGSGDIKITKDGKVLLDEMHITNPTAGMIASTASTQDRISGDGTTSTILIIGELLKQAERYLLEGVHPRIIVEAFKLCRTKAVDFLDSFKIEKEITKEFLIEVAQTSLRTKLKQEVADLLSEIVVNAVLTVKREPNKKTGVIPIDLHMIEMMLMQHKLDTETKFIDGIVLDHGPRHPKMPKRVENAYILTCNVSLEYEKTEINSKFFYSTGEEREKQVKAERSFVNARVQKIIDLKNEVCKDGKHGFVVVNQKGIDPESLELLQKAGIMGMRRAKKRNMERLTLACGGIPLNSLEDMTIEVLGEAGLVYEHILGEEKFCFIEKPKKPKACTILIKGPNKYTITQLKDAVRDGLRAVKNVFDDKCVIPGAGCFELALHRHLLEFKKSVKGKMKLGVQAFADAMLVIPKVLVENAGFDHQDVLINVLEEFEKGNKVGINLESGEAMDPQLMGVWDNYKVKRQQLNSCSIIASQLLLVDEVISAGKSEKKDKMKH